MMISVGNIGVVGAAARRRGGGYQFANAEAAAFVARFTTQPDNARKALIDTLVGAGKAHGWWSDVDALVLPGKDSQCSLLNWKSASFDSSTVGAPTFTADRGFVTDGSSSYLNTNFNPATAGGQFTQNSAVFAVWLGQNVQRANSVAGWFDGTDGVTINPRSATDSALWRLNHASSSSVANSNGSGLIAIDRPDATNTNAYRNGALLGSSARTSVAVNDAPLQIGRITAANYQVVEWLGHVIGKSLGGTKNASLYTDIAAYLSAIGAI